MQHCHASGFNQVAYLKLKHTSAYIFIGNWFNEASLEFTLNPVSEIAASCPTPTYNQFF